MSMQKDKLRGQRSKVTEVKQNNLAISGLQLQFEFTCDDEMMHKAWWGLEKVPYDFLRSSVEFQGHMAQKNFDFDRNWVFPGCNSSLNSPMVMKWCTKFKIA